MKITVYDRTSYAIPSQRTVTDEGFLLVPGHVAKVGTQDYLASELGLSGDPFRIVTVYRPEESVFEPSSLVCYDSVDVTLNHPDTFVNSENYKEHSKGVIKGSGKRDGDMVRCDLLIKDKDAIDAVNSGKCELSAGYEAEYIYGPGVTKDGVSYEYTQRKIKVNHVAIVDRARAGRNARIFDKGIDDMIKVKIGDKEVEMNADEVTAHINQLTVDKDTMEAERDNAREEVKRVKMERGESDYDVEKLRERVRELEAEKNESAKKKVTEDATIIVGKEVTLDGETPIAIMRQALDSAGISTDGKSDTYVEVMFDREVIDRKKAGEQHKQFTDDVVTSTTVDSGQSVLEAAQAAYLTSLEKGNK